MISGASAQTCAFVRLAQCHWTALCFQMCRRQILDRRIQHPWVAFQQLLLNWNHSFDLPSLPTWTPCDGSWHASSSRLSYVQQMLTLLELLESPWSVPINRSGNARCPFDSSANRCMQVMQVFGRSFARDMLFATSAWDLRRNRCNWSGNEYFSVSD